MSNYSHYNYVSKNQSSLSKWSRNHTCDININGCEGCERHGSDILRSNPEIEEGSGFVVQRLRDQNGCRAIFTIWREVETNGHVGFGHHPVLQVVGHSRIAQLRGRLDCLNGRKSYIKIIKMILQVTFRLAGGG